jgi:hypothetical protein
LLPRLVQNDCYGSLPSVARFVCPASYVVFHYAASLKGDQSGSSVSLSSDRTIHYGGYQIMRTYEIQDMFAYTNIVVLATWIQLGSDIDSKAAEDLVGRVILSSRWNPYCD